MNLPEKKGVKKELFKLLDEMPLGKQFKGIYLQQEINRRTGKMHYPETYLRYMRQYRREKRLIVNIDKAKSIYEVR